VSFAKNSEYWFTFDMFDFRKEFGYMGHIPYKLNNPEVQVYQNFWGKTGANMHQTYQDKNFDDVNLGNRHFGHQNGIVLRKSSRLWNLTPMKYIIYGEIDIRPSNTFRKGADYNHYNHYGIRGYRNTGWQFQNVMRLFNSNTKHASPL